MKLGTYRALTGAAGAAAIPILRARAALGDGDARERLAFAGPAATPGDGPPAPPSWFHAASVGEVQAVLPVLTEIRRRREGAALVVSTMTVTGRAVARERAPWGRPFLFPLDIPSVARRALARIAPRALLIAETEIWPAMIGAAGERGVPLALVNGRISERAFRRYRMIGPLVRECLSAFRVLIVQTEGDRARYTSLGAPEDRLHVAGNTKVDAEVALPDPAARAAERARRGIPAGAPLLVAGSVRPGELDIVLDAFALARKEIPALRMILAPRHLDRVAETESGVLSRGFIARRWSLSSFPPAPAAASDAAAGAADILIVDTLGELAGAYGLGEAAFVGGTLHARYGGHNPLEPAARGTPVLLGPHRRNVLAESDALLAAGGAREVGDARAFASALIYWLGSAGGYHEAGRRAMLAVGELAGAARRTVDLLEASGFAW